MRAKIKKNNNKHFAAVFVVVLVCCLLPTAPVQVLPEPAVVAISATASERCESRPVRCSARSRLGRLR